MQRNWTDDSKIPRPDMNSRPLHLGCNSQIVGSLVFFYCPFALLNAIVDRSAIVAFDHGAIDDGRRPLRKPVMQALISGFRST
jgi:hypothetical protein